MKPNAKARWREGRHEGISLVCYSFTVFFVPSRRGWFDSYGIKKREPACRLIRRY